MKEKIIIKGKIPRHKPKSGVKNTKVERSVKTYRRREKHEKKTESEVG